MNALVRHIKAWTAVQTLYILGVASLHARAAPRNETAQSPSPQDLCLWLLSALSCQVPCDTKLEELEWKLHTDEAHDVLNELHQALRSRSHMLCFKDRFLWGQGANTHARNSLKLVDAKLDASAAKYCAACGALLALSPLLGKVGWKDTLQPLEDCDICAMTDSTDVMPGEGHRQLSWIWLTCGYNGDGINGDVDEGLVDGK